MSRIHKEHLQAGYIFGDNVNQEYIYLPSGEVGTEHPLAVLETPTKREDITLDEADAIEGISVPFHKGAVKYYESAGVDVTTEKGSK